MFLFFTCFDRFIYSNNKIIYFLKELDQQELSHVFSKNIYKTGIIYLGHLFILKKNYNLFFYKTNIIEINN